MQDANVGSRTSYVVVQVGALDVAVGVNHALQALPVPATMTMLPRRDGAIVGVAPYGELTVPVIDLARWVDVGATSEQDKHENKLHARRILILQAENKIAGILVDAVRGVVSVSDTQIQRVHHGDDAEEIFQSIARHEEQMLSLLDIGRLMNLCDVWAQKDPSLGTATTTVEEKTGTAQKTSRLHALFVAGTERIAVPSSLVAEVLPMPSRQSIGANTGTEFCTWRGRHIPVVALPHMKNGDDAMSRPLLVVMAHNGLAVGIPANEMLHLVEIDPPSDASSNAGERVWNGTTIDDDGTPVHIFNAAKFIDELPQTRISQVQAQTTSAAQNARNGNTLPYIVFESRHSLCVAINEVSEVTRVPADLRTNGIDGSHAATVSWRGQALPVVDWRKNASDIHSNEERGALMVVNRDGTPVGLLVDAVRELVPANAGEISRFGLARDAAFSMLTTGESDARASYRIFDPATLSV